MTDEQMTYEQLIGEVLTLAGIHTAKRGKRERSGVHAWHPYCAEYEDMPGPSGRQGSQWMPWMTWAD